jgi:sulfur carrier protein
MSVDVTINGKICKFDSEITVHEVLSQIKVPAEHVAVELNENIIQREDYSKTVVSEGDKIEVLRFVGGG